MGEKTSNKAQRINLFCPSLSKLSTFVAWDDHHLDLGTIARTFGIDPATLKLNGHFISRGADLFASSVTWKSLLSFFSSRGLSTGTDGSPALLVDGKLSKSGTKRAHDPEIELISKKVKTKENSSASGGENGKRKLWLEAISPLKRTKTDGTYSNTFSESHEAKGEGMPRFGSSEFKCSYQCETMKRAREDQVLVEASCKRTR